MSSVIERTPSQHRSNTTFVRSPLSVIDPNMGVAPQIEAMRVQSRPLDMRMVPEVGFHPVKPDLSKDTEAETAVRVSDKANPPQATRSINGKPNENSMNRKALTSTSKLSEWNAASTEKTLAKTEKPVASEPPKLKSKKSLTDLNPSMSLGKLSSHLHLAKKARQLSDSIPDKRPSRPNSRSRSSNSTNTPVSPSRTAYASIGMRPATPSGTRSAPTSRTSSFMLQQVTESVDSQIAAARPSSCNEQNASEVTLMKMSDLVPSRTVPSAHLSMPPVLSKKEKEAHCGEVYFRRSALLRRWYRGQAQLERGWLEVTYLQNRRKNFCVLLKDVEDFRIRKLGKYFLIEMVTRGHRQTVAWKDSGRRDEWFDLIRDEARKSRT